MTLAWGTIPRELDLPLFDLASIAPATDQFSTENLLGEGGFGPVYMVNNSPLLLINPSLNFKIRREPERERGRN